MMYWDEELNRYGKFGGIKEAARKQIEQGANSTRWLCYIAFDIVYLNGEDLRQFSYLDRRRRLNDLVFTVIDKKMEMSPFFEIDFNWAKSKNSEIREKGIL